MKDMTKNDVTIKGETRFSIPENEVLLSFNSDWMAEAFESWWIENQNKFIEYANKYIEEFK